MSTAPPQSFLHGLFPQTVHSEQRELHRLRLENASLKTRLNVSQAAVRSSEDTLKKLLANLEIITTRASTNISKAVPISSQQTEHAIYAMASTLRAEHPCLDVLAGRQIIAHIVALMNVHFRMMLEHAEYTFAPAEGLDAQQKEHLTRVVLANLICWVFGVQVQDWDKFIAPKAGFTLREEIPHTIKACMALRSFDATHNKFPVALMFTFILNWNAFAVEQIGVHPLPIDPKLGLSIPMTPMVFKDNIVCECVVHCKKDHKGNENLTLRMYPVEKSTLHQQQQQRPHLKMPMRLIQNSPGTYAIAAARSLVAPAPPPMVIAAASAEKINSSIPLPSAPEAEPAAAAH